VDPGACEKAMEQVVAHFGGIDSLINCAGVVRSEGMLDIPSQDLAFMIDVNLKGTFHTCQSALTHFAKQKSGRIVNLASVAAQRGGGLVGGAHYAASKGGVLSLTKAIAREFGPQGIRANAICPSMTETGMLDGNVNDEQFQQVVAGIPLRRAGKPLDIANACLFLASDLSAYITGHTLDVNGGGHIH
jgi:NAD(P)-dependent dehydrogenase (short-subunit alcohol dehydrogenase family)